MRFFYARVNNKSLLPIERRLNISGPLSCARLRAKLPVGVFRVNAASANSGKTTPFPFAAWAIVAISPVKRRRVGTGAGQRGTTDQILDRGEASALRDGDETGRAAKRGSEISLDTNSIKLPPAALVALVTRIRRSTSRYIGKLATLVELSVASPKHSMFRGWLNSPGTACYVPSYSPERERPESNLRDGLLLQ